MATPRAVQVITLLAVAALLVAACGTAFAANWSYVGSSTLTTSPAFLQDYDRVVINSMTVDGAGNVFCTTNNLDNNHRSGGVTIFKADGSKVYIDVNALGYPGGITRLVTAGDGKVYGLQNWREVWAWGYPDFVTYYTEGRPEKILRFNLNGTVDMIAEARSNTPPDTAHLGDGWLSVYATGAGTPSIFDIPSEPGNKGMRMAGTGNGSMLMHYKKTKDSEGTLAARFYLESVPAATSKTYIMELYAGGCKTTPVVAIAVRQDGSFWLTNCIGDDAAGAGNLQMLGPVVANQMNTCYLYVNGLTGQVKVNWNGTTYSFAVTDWNKLYGGPAAVWPAAVGGSTRGEGVGCIEFGATTHDGTGGSTVVFDWVNYARSYVTSPTSPECISLLDGSLIDGASSYFGIGRRNNMQGMDVGPDGNIYFDVSTTGMPWRMPPNWLWRYDVTAGTLTSFNTFGGDNNLDTFGNLLYTRDGYFAIVQGNEPTRNCCPLKVDMGKCKTNAALVGSMDPGWGRQNKTAMAYDPLRNNLWAGYRANNVAGSIYSSGEVASGQWKTSELVDIAGEPGNKGIRLQKLANPALTPADSTANCWQTSFNPGGIGQPQVTVASRFRVDAFSGAAGTRFIMNAPQGNPKANPPETRNFAPWVWVGVYDVAGSLRWQLGLDPDGAGNPNEVVLADLGPFVAGVFNEVYIYSEATLNGTAKKAVVWWNGTKVFDAEVPDADCAWNGPAGGGNNGSYIVFGPGAWNNAPVTGTATATYDYVNLGRGLIQPTDPTKAWEVSYNGAYQPSALNSWKTTIVTKFTNGMGSATSVWGEITPNADPALRGAATIGSVSHVHANGLAPNVPAKRRAPGWYWVNTMDINPVDGRCWMAWGSDQYYDYGDIGHVLTRDVAWNLGDEGVPEPGAQVSAVKFDGGKVYALVCNLTTGVYSLYKTDRPGTTGPQSVGSMKRGSPGTFISTDVPKVVTFPAATSSLEYFYIQDADRNAGIKVLTTGTAGVAFKGDKVSVSGMLDQVGGEAVLTNAIVTYDSPGSDPAPLGVVGKAVGGGGSPAQPATTPGIGLNTVGLLVKLAGIATLVDDDVVGYQWLAVNDGSGATVTYTSSLGPVTVQGIKVIYDDWPWTLTTGDKVSVTGVVSVEGGKPILRARSVGDLTPY